MKLPTLCLFVPTACTAILVNYTIDDTYGDSNTGITPTYLPEADWANGSTCRSCNIYPANLEHLSAVPLKGAAVDLAKTFNGTWHDTTYRPGSLPRNVTVHFFGQAVYVFNIIANIVPFTATNTILDFSLDGAVVGRYAHYPDLFGPEVVYNVAVYVNNSLPNGNHTLVMSTGGTADSSLVLFDHVVYTATDDPVSAMPSAHITDHTTSIQTLSVQTSSVQTPPVYTTPLIVATTSLLQWTSPQEPSASATAPHPSSEKSATSTGIVVVGSVVGTVLLGLTVTLLRKCKRRARTQVRCNSPDAMISIFPDAVTITTTSPPHTIRSPCSSEGFSRAATLPDSRRARSLSDTAKEARPASSPPTDRYSARVRLYTKVTAASRPRVPRRVGPRPQSLPFVTVDSAHPEDCEDLVPRHIDPQGDLCKGPSGTPRNLRAEVAVLREEIAPFRETELAIYGLPARVPPPYQHGPRTASALERQPNLTAS